MALTARDTRPHLTLSAFVKLADLFIAEGRHEQSLPLLQMCLSHPAGEKWTRERAEHLLSQFAPERRTFTPEQINPGQLNEMVQAALSNLLAEAQNPPPQSIPLPDPLTERELEILHLISTGLSNREIAERLVLALGTVKWYIGEIYSKLHVASRTQAIARARELKLLA